MAGMTGKTFRTHVYVTIAALLIASFVTLWIGVQCTEDYASASRTIVPVYITVAAAWLTFGLQRRVAYTNALRSLWEKVVHSVHEAIHYTRLKSPTESDLESLRCELCCRIDEVRGVFRNVGEIYLRPSAQVAVFVRSVKHAEDSEQLERLLGNEHIDESMIGLYPFESLKQILTVIEQLGSGSTASRQHSPRHHLAALAHTPI
jgi:hypothetical protein